MEYDTVNENEGTGTIFLMKMGREKNLRANVFLPLLMISYDIRIKAVVKLVKYYIILPFRLH